MRGITCREVRRLLDPRLADQLPPRLAEAIREHLEECPACRASVPDALAVDHLVRRWAGAFPPAELDKTALDHLAATMADQSGLIPPAPSSAGPRPSWLAGLIAPALRVVSHPAVLVKAAGRTLAWRLGRLAHRTLATATNTVRRLPGLRADKRLEITLPGRNLLRSARRAGRAAARLADWLGLGALVWE